MNLSQDDFTWWEKSVRDYKSFSYPIPELLNRFGKDILVDEFHVIHKKRKEKVDLNAEESAWWEKYAKITEPPGYASAWVKDENTAFDIGSVIDFRTGNYLYDEKLYENLRKLAIKDRIFSFKMDLSNREHVIQLARSIDQSHLKISVLDLDNAFIKEYLGQENYHSILEALRGVVQPDSILLAMHNYKNFGAAQFQTYIGFRFSNVAKWPKKFMMQDFFFTLPKELFDLISGRLYEEFEMPPLNYLENKEKDKK